MELKDLIALAAVAVTAAGVLVAWLKHRHDVQVRKEESEPRPAKPFADVIHTVTRCSIGPDRHALRLELSNREERLIAVKEVFWHVKSFKTRWPLSYSCPLLPEPSALPQYKLETADLLQLDIDIRDIFKPLLGSRELPILDTIVAIATLDVGVVLTTGEAILMHTPWTFRAFLAGEIVRPSWLAPLVKFYVWVRP
jgi:hypothetical protein